MIIILHLLNARQWIQVVIWFNQTNILKQTYVYVCTQLLSCIQNCNPMDCSPPGSSVHRIFQAKILKQVTISYSRNQININKDIRYGIFFFLNEGRIKLSSASKITQLAKGQSLSTSHCRGSILNHKTLQCYR